MKPILRWCCIVATAILLTGCSSLEGRKYGVLAVPLQPTLQQEVMLARMEQILASQVLSNDERAQLLYERGVLFDSLGLRALARNDFSQALMIRPDIPEAFPASAALPVHPGRETLWQISPAQVTSGNILTDSPATAGKNSGSPAVFHPPSPAETDS